MSALADLAADAGILPEFRDLEGVTRPTAPETQRALLRAAGLDVEGEASARAALAERRAARAARRLKPEYVLPADTAPTLPLDGLDWRLAIEGGGSVEGRGDALPALPPGIHGLFVGDERTRLIAAPSACPSVEAVTGRERIWGVTAALYGLHGAGGGAMGSYETLAVAADALGREGADFLGINPVHSLGWADRETISPYSPSHRGFLDTRYIATGEKAAALRHDDRLIDYPTLCAARRDRLEARYEREGAVPDATFDRFRADRGGTLADFALYEALSERHGTDWRDWPEPLARREPDALAAARREHAGRIRFHEWLQWQADAQVGDAQRRARGAGMALGLYLDLAVGPRRGGAESWCEAGAVARGVSLGAPPDHLGPDGQNWQLAAYAPEALAAADYAPLRRILRETMRHAGMIRIDHVLGFARSYWIPDDGAPGGYIRQPMDALLAIVAIEAVRAGCVVIGEDLGLVPDGLRAGLRARGLYGYSVLQYERDAKGRLRDPATLRPDSLLCFGTHDTPTIKGFWLGRDIDWWHRLGWIDKAEAKLAHKRREQDRRALGGTGEDRYAGSGVSPRITGAMMTAPAALVALQLDDIMDHAEAQNLPGTVAEHPNWRRRYYSPVEQLDVDGAVAALAPHAEYGNRQRNRDERTTS